MKTPKTIKNHPAVETVTSGYDQGSDYKYWVDLKHEPMHRFTHGSKEGSTSGGFNTVKEFLYAEPAQVN